MESSTYSIYNSREKLIATCVIFTCILLSTLTIILMVAISQTYKLNGALQEAREVARVITSKYGWLLGIDEDTTDTLVM